MPDFKMEMVSDFQSNLVSVFSQNDIEIVSTVLVKVLANYEVTKISTELTVYDSVNSKLLKKYLACLYVDGKSEKTAYQYKRTCERLAASIDKNFTEMNAYDIRYFLACERERGISARSAENLRANISAFFQWMAREEIIQKNPCFAIKPIKYPEVVRKPFSEIEIDSLRNGCLVKKERALVEVLLSTGARVSEVSEMKISDIDQTDLSVRIRCGNGGKGRTTYLSSVAMKHLTAYLDERKTESDSLFINQSGEPLRPNGIRFILKRIGKRAGVSNVHPHRFRRTFASSLAARGMSIQEVKKLLGHSNINTTMEYVYTDDRKVSASYRQLIA